MRKLYISVSMLSIILACSKGNRDTITGNSEVVSSGEVGSSSNNAQYSAPVADDTPDMTFNFDENGTLTVINNRAYDVSGKVCAYRYKDYYTQEFSGEYNATFTRGKSVTGFYPLKYKLIPSDVCREYVFQLDAVRADYTCPDNPFKLGGSGFFKGKAGIVYKNEVCPTPTPTPYPSPTPTPTPTPTPSPSPSPSPTPTPGQCYYRVSCGITSTSCDEQNQKYICESTKGGNPLAYGIWRNFGDMNLRNHCQFTVPGVSLLNFQLNPGQSDENCMNKKS